MLVQVGVVVKFQRNLCKILSDLLFVLDLRLFKGCRRPDRFICLFTLQRTHTCIHVSISVSTVVTPSQTSPVPTAINPEIRISSSTTVLPLFRTASCNFDAVPPSPPWYQNFPVPSFNNKCFYWECYFALAIVPSPQVFHLCAEHCSLHICRLSGQTCVRNDRGSNNFQFRNSFSTLITSLVTPSCSLRRTWIHSWRWFSVNALFKKKKSWSTSPVSVYKMKGKRMEWKCPHVEKWKHGQQMAISLPRAIAKQICNS